MSESLNNIGGMANTNQQMGQGNAALGFLMGRQFGRRGKKGSRGGGGGQDKVWFENMAELERHKAQLRMTESANDANIRDLEQMRAHGGTEEDVMGSATTDENGETVSRTPGKGHIGMKIKTARDASVIRDEEGRVIGEIASSESGPHGKINVGGYRTVLSEQKADSNDSLSSGQQMAPVTGSGKGLFLGSHIPVLTDANSTITMPSRGRHAKGPKHLQISPGWQVHNPETNKFERNPEYDKFNEQQDIQEQQLNPENAGTGTHAKPWSGND